MEDKRWNQMVDLVNEGRPVTDLNPPVQNDEEERIFNNMVRDLVEKLEKALVGAVRMVKIHPFSYAMFDTGRLKQADLYIIPDSRAEEYRDWVMPGSGLPVYDPVSGQAVGEDCFLYSQTETYRLYMGNASVHLEDGLARKTSELLFSLNNAVTEDTP